MKRLQPLFMEKVKVKARKHTQVNNNLSGLERKEIYVDARDLQQTVDDVKCQMHNILPHCNQEEKKN